MADPGRTTGFPCKQCVMVCPNMPSLLEHMDAHLQEEEERKFKCDECGRGYRHAGSLANHKKTHEVGSFQCDICGKENSNALALKSHLRSHTYQKKYSCAECGKAFRLATQLTTHQRVHFAKRVKEKSYRKVDMEYPTDEIEIEIENDLSEQSGSVRNSTENSPIDDDMDAVYNPQFETPDDAATRPYRCDLCDKSYIHHRSLTNHKKTHQVGMFECTVCFKLFNNMAALYSHQRTHKTRSGADPDSMGGSYTRTPLDQFSPQSQEAPVNFCHLCQVLFPNDEEFQEHIQMHNSSSLSFGLRDTLSESHNRSYDNSIASPGSKLYASPINNIPSVSSIDNHGFEQPQELISNGLMYSDCVNNETPPFNSTQGEPLIIDPSVLNSALMQDSDDAPETEETSTEDSHERPFRCRICSKSYRHSGSLINHKRSHQVGIYQCSICRKSYPHLAALKSHLRLHKAQSASVGFTAEGDWLSSEPLTHDTQQGCFSSQDEEEEEEVEEHGAATVLGMNPGNGVDRSNGALYHEPFKQDFSQDVMHLPHNEHPMQRHMCADCGETFADIAGIKSHSCPLLQQHHNTTSSDFDSNIDFQESNGQRLVTNPGSNVEFHGLNGSHDQSYFEQNFHDNMSIDQLNGDGEGGDAEGEEEEEEEEDAADDDGDIYQCSICRNNYTSMRALRSHLRGHTQSHGTPASSGPSSMSSHEEMKVELGEMMICSTCGESFANRQDLIIHQVLHKQDQVDNVYHKNMSDCGVFVGKEEAPSIICGSCGIFCTNYHHLENHGCTAERTIESTHRGEGMKTNGPGQEDASNANKTLDSEDRQYKCDQCGRSYRHAGSLLNHKKSHKTGVFRCLVCQKRFYNLLALKNHQRSHFDIKRHTCHECGKAFKIQKQLLNHLRRHKENQAKIQDLNDQIQALMQMNGTKSEVGTQTAPPDAGPALSSSRRCKQPRGARRGRARCETAVKSEDTGDPRPFACDQCGRTYRHAGSLVNHRNSHKTGEYYCSVCNNTYSNQLAMKNHLRTHFAYKKHSCQNCRKGFRGQKQLLAHVCGDLRRVGTRSRRGAKSRALRCNECKQAFLSADLLRAHACDGRSGSGEARTDAPAGKEERPFACSMCDRSYRHAGSLLNHKNTHKTGSFSCSFCSKPFTNPMALRNHTRIHTQKKKYACLTCGKAFRLASILHNHQRVHSRVASQFSCPACKKSFQGRSGLKRHRCRRGQENSPRAGVQQSERGDKCFMCDLCGRSYRHAGSLLNHKKSHSENLHHCTLCLQTFPDPLTLQIHSMMRRHCCPECGKTFCLVAHLQSHMEVHSKDQAVARSPCQQSFPNASSYQQHRDTRHRAQDSFQRGAAEPEDVDACWDPRINQAAGIDEMRRQPPPLPPPLTHIPGSVTNSQASHEGCGAEEKSHVCEHCGRTYRHAGSLLNHKNSHKTGSFFCSVCQKEFTNLMALKNHRRIHTEPKRYQCLECGKAFRVSTQLICHRRIHTKEKPFACPLCDKSFSSKSNLRHHQKMHQNSQTYDSSFSSMDANSFMDLDMGSFL